MRRAKSFRVPSVYVWATVLVLCVGTSSHAAAQAPLQTGVPVSAQPLGSAREDPETVISDARALLEKARFDAAKQRAQRLLGRDDLDASTISLRKGSWTKYLMADTLATQQRT